MSDDQQKLLIAALVVIGLGLAYNMLAWTSEFHHEDWTPIFIFYEDLDPLGHVERWGLFTREAKWALFSARSCRFASLL